MKINLNNCKKGDKLRIRTTQSWIDANNVPAPTDIVTYVKKESATHLDFPHVIEYSTGGVGTRTDEGHTFKRKRLPDDPDVLEVL